MKPCKGCGRMILWARTSTGQRIPLDPAAPVYRIDADGGGGEVVASLIPRTDREQVGGSAVSHFATCTKADQFGAGKRKPASAGPATDAVSRSIDPQTRRVTP